MGPAPRTATTTYSSAKNAKELLDMIGKDVHDQVKSESNGFKDELKGDLASASIFGGERASSNKPCTFEYDKLINGSGSGGAARGKRHPCGTGDAKKEERFSDTLGGQCTREKISGSTNTCGACAPYRRLHLCSHNLETINNTTSTTTHKLLAEVCMAAKYEGQSLVEQYEKHKKNYPHTNICTVLARSFADIGDIIRGKDLFLGHKQGKQHLEKRLESMFKNIQNKNENLKSLSLDKVREYWWALNRDQVWKAITCDAAVEDTYFKTSSGGEYKFTSGYCGRDETDVPTNLDYVPQFLRWFDEWSEEFCRKRNNTLKIAKEVCQNDKKQLYCSLNGYNCTKLIRNKNYCSRDPICTPCSNKCIPYDLWLRNRRDEFKMQKGKYENEIKTYESDNDISNSNTKKEYYKEFYEELKKSYKSVENFLTLLNNGRYCEEKIQEEENIDFNKDEDNVFHRSKYCQVCPACVVDCKTGKCEEKKNSDGSCVNAQKYTRPKDVTPKIIKVLFSGDHQKDITEKLSSFCKNPESENNRDYQTWQCYYKSSDYNNCEMKGSSYKEKHDPNIIISDKCFHLWVQSLLIDTI
ncbi:hypothetical protein PFMC_05924, partial [Plasmodium falciparum CAMP/Malaysia]